MPKSSFKRLMVGSSLKNQGGIISVIQMYKESGFLDNTYYCETHIDGSAVQKLLIFSKALIKISTLLLTNKEINLVHLHTSEKGSFYRKSILIAICHIFRRKTILHMHGAEFLTFYQKSPIFMRGIIRNVLTSVSAVIALSNQWKQDILSIAPLSNVQVIFNPCIVRKKLEIENHKTNFRLLFLGRMGHRKGVYDLINAIARLEISNVHLDLYGDGEVKEVHSIVKQLGLQDRIHVHGWIDASTKEVVFSGADALVLPSYNEGLPIAILEAISYGLPVITTPVGGIPEAVIDNFNGYFVPPGEPELLAIRIQELARNPEIVKKMGAASLELALQRFEIKSIIVNLEKLYAEVLTGSQESAPV